MINNDSINYFDILIGEQLSSVTFVMDYLQLDFDGNTLTCNVWPVVNVGNNSYKYHQTEYRNMLCLLKTDKVNKVDVKINSHLKIEFSKGNFITISLDNENPELVTPEILTFTDISNSLYILWKQPITTGSNIKGF